VQKSWGYYNPGAAATLHITSLSWSKSATWESVVRIDWVSDVLACMPLQLQAWGVKEFMKITLSSFWAAVRVTESYPL
jgi:hypothetical protein